MQALLDAVAYPLKRAGVLVVAAVLIGELPYSGLVPSLFVLSFTIPIVLDSGTTRIGSAWRLVPTMPGLGPALGAGFALNLVYLFPSLLVYGLVYAADEVPQLQMLFPLTMLAFVLQVVLLVFWPAGVAVLALEGSVMPALARARVMKMAGDLGAAFGGVVAYVLICGGTLVVFQDLLADLGRVGWIAIAVLAAWFWIVGLHLVGRALRSRGKLEAAPRQD